MRSYSGGATRRWYYPERLHLATSSFTVDVRYLILFYLTLSLSCYGPEIAFATGTFHIYAFTTAEFHFLLHPSNISKAFCWLAVLMTYSTACASLYLMPFDNAWDYVHRGCWHEVSCPFCIRHSVNLHSHLFFMARATIRKPFTTSGVIVKAVSLPKTLTAASRVWAVQVLVADHLFRSAKGTSPW